MADPAVEETPADANVVAAFALGWQMADLYRHPASKADLDAANKPRLPGVGSLSPGQQTELGLRQIAAGLHLLADVFTKAGVTPPTTEATDGVFTGGGAPAAVKQAVYRLHVDVLAALTAADFRAGKAYGLGRALAESVHVEVVIESYAPPDAKDRAIAAAQRELEQLWSTYRIGTIQSWLNDLNTALPAHSARAVSRSIDHWQRWLTAPDWRSRASFAKVRGRLLRQGRQWRALLSGEKDGIDMLDPDDYVDAAGLALQDGRLLLQRVLSRFREIAALALALIVLGVVLALASSDTAKILTGAGAVLGGLGLTWGTIGKSFGAVVEHLRRPLWGAELNEAIADAMTTLPDADPPPRTPASGPVSALPPDAQ